jgi:integrase
MMRAMVNPISDCLDARGMGVDQTSEEKAMAKKRAPKRQAWNKGLEVGQKDAFTPAQVKRIRQVLADRGVPGLRELALFSVAIDTMLQGPELLNLTVKDVALGNGTIRPIIEVARTRRKPPVRCALSKATAQALGKWIAVSDKKRTDYIFPGRGAGRPRPMTVRQMNRLLKFWVAEAGLDPRKYGKESLRRTKALHILNGTGDIEAVRVLLGHTKIESTARYLRIAKRSDPIAISRAFDI